MKKVLTIIISILLVLCVSGCNSSNDVMKVSESISNITSDNEGNVIISLIDGRTFSLGNLKGKKGDKGEKGDSGIDGINGLNGKDGKNGEDGINGKDGINGTNANNIDDYVKDIYLDDNNKLMAKYGDDSTNLINRINLAGDYKLTFKYNVNCNSDTPCDMVFEDDVIYYDEGDLIDTVVFPGQKSYYNLHLEEELEDPYNIAHFEVDLNENPDFYYMGDYYDGHPVIHIIKSIMPSEDKVYNFTLNQLSNIKINEIFELNSELVTYNSDIWYCNSHLGPGYYLIFDDLDYSFRYYDFENNNSYIIEFDKNNDAHSREVPEHNEIYNFNYNIVASSNAYSNFIKLNVNDIARDCYNGIDTYNTSDFINYLNSYLTNLGLTDYEIVNNHDSEDVRWVVLKIEFDSQYFNSGKNDGYKKISNLLPFNYYIDPNTKLKITLQDSPAY